MKSQIWLLDPRPNLPTIVRAVEEGFELSEASHTPVMLEVRIRACHVHGRFVAKDNKKPDFTLREALENPARDTNRIVLPPASYLHEREKVEQRWPAAVEFIKERKLNEFFGPETGRCRHRRAGRHVQFGDARRCSSSASPTSMAKPSVPIYCLNVTYPLIDDEVAAFCRRQEGHPHGRGGPARIHRAGAEHHPAPPRHSDQDHRARTCCRWPANTPPQVVSKASRRSSSFTPRICSAIHRRPPDASAVLADPKIKELAKTVPPRPPSFCIGCPERPIFAAMKLVEQELGPHQIAGDIGCHLFASLPPFNIGATTMGYGLGPASSSAFNVKADKKPISVIGDGGFWHNGLSTSVANAVYNKHDGVIMVVDNFYSAATGGQDIMSSRAINPARATNNSIVDAVKGIGVKWVRHIDRTYDVAAHARHFARGADHRKTAARK